MKIIELNLKDCTCLYDIHEKIQKAFNFSELYGKNWSAFWDLLWSECDADKVIIKGESSLPDELKDSIVKLHEILERNIVFRKSNNLTPFCFEIYN